MNMLLAVLEKRAGFKLAQKDVFLNIAGGLKVNDPAIDLAVISAILSSSLDISIESQVCMCGEVGLSGEIRPVNRIEQRILEAEKLGFSRIIIPWNNLKGFDTTKCKIQIVQVRKLEEAFRHLFGSFIYKTKHMIQEIQLRLLPEQAANEQTLKNIVARETGFTIDHIYAIRTLKRSIDARQRTIYINLKVRVFIDEQPDEQLFPVIDYKDVSSGKPVIVVGAGPGGLFAALRLIE